MRSGTRLTVNKDYFERDGKPFAVVGTTYMSSEAQRLYFEYPNVYVWNQELGQIHAAGLNTIRTGWWTGWDKFCNENGEPYDRTLRVVEAYLMTARRNDLPVQFNFFAFLPEVLGAAADPDLIGGRALPRCAFSGLGLHQRAQHLAASVDDAPKWRFDRTCRMESVAG